MDKVIAAVRCRPITVREQKAGHTPAIQIVQETKQVIVSKERAFHFNYAYPEEASQDNVFDDLVSPVVDRLMEGYNACVMAYGQTGSGKTYTMGTTANATTPGIIQKAVNKIFASNLFADESSEIHVSFLEVYNKEVLDLLSPEKKKMQLIDFKPVGLTLAKAVNSEDALGALERGLGNRHVGATNANVHSSRSHAIFTIHLTKTSGDGLRSSKLYLVDLAGSESVSDESGDTRREGLMINQGLLQLGIVMSTLSAGQDPPYRSSALTAILKDSLSLQNFIVLIACVSPLSSDANRTLKSLQFASRVGNMKINPEAGILIKQRVPVTTPFKVPSNFRKRVNTTIATPGSHRKVHRPTLRPLNNTIDSPRTPRVKAKQCWPTSTPLQEVSKPLFDDPTPISKTRNNGAFKRRSSSDWSPLNISTSTVMDSMAPYSMAHATLAQNPENETWLRSIIADVIREELKSHTLLSQTQQSFQKQDPKPPRRSARLSKISCSDSVYTDETIVSRAPENSVSANHPCPRRSTRLSESLSSPFSQEDLGTTVVQSSPNIRPLKRSEAIKITAARPPVRRSTRLSVVPRPIYFNDASSPLTKAPTQSKKAARFSSRLSLMPQETAEEKQRILNDAVLDVLRSGDIKRLQSLPTIGPKTAAILRTHQQLFGPIETFKDLETVRGLSKNFTKRFLWANNIVNDDDSV